jgi:hypothetical protein
MLVPMSLDLWSTIADIGTFFVIAATAFAAFVQLRHLRSNNELQAFLAVERDFHSAELQRAFEFVQTNLQARMGDAAFRQELAAIGFIDAQKHPEMEVCNWFDKVGMLVKAGFVHEEVFFAMFGRLVDYYWNVLAPTIAVLRRKRGPMQYESFEYIAMRAKRWRAAHPNGNYPARTPRATLVDNWLAMDSTAALTPAPLSVTTIAEPHSV